MEKTRMITTTAMMIAISAVLSLLIYVVPFIQLIIGIIALPLIVVGVKYDFKIQIIGLIALTLVLTMIDPIYSMNILILIGPTSLVHGYLIKENKDNSEIIFISALVMVLSLIGLLYVTNLVLDVNIISELKLYVDTTVDEMKAFYSSTSMLSDEEMTLYLQGLTQMKELMIVMIPTFIFYFSLFAVVFNHFIVSKLLSRFGFEKKKSYFKDFRLDKTKRGILLTVMLVVTIVSFMNQNQMDVYILNFMSILILVLQVNGLALVWYYTEKHPNRKALRVITIILFIISPILGIVETIVRYGLSFVGFLDMYLDFRSRKKTE